MNTSTNTKPHKTNSCSSCKTLVPINHLKCSICHQLLHFMCANVPVNTVKNNHNIFKNWFCSDCSNIFPFHALSNTEIEILYSSTYHATKNPDIYTAIKKYKDIDKISDKEFSIFNHSNTPTDPELNFYSKLTKDCDYYCDTQFNTVFREINGFALIHFNARSLNANCQKIDCYLKLLNKSFDVIVISETWINPGCLVNFLPNYTPYSVNRKLHKGGGVSIFVKNTLSCKLLNHDSNSHENLFDCVSIEITSQAKRNTIITSIYRKPGTNINEFTNMLEEILTPIKNKSLYLCGDFNIDLLKYETHDQTRHFTDMLFSLGLFPLINRPTRITNTSETLIDNIFTNFISSVNYSGILISDISDHLPVFTIIPTEIQHKSKPEIILKRKIDDKSMEKLKQCLKEENWNLVYESENANQSYNEFVNIVMSNFNKCCPEREVEIQTNNKNSKPWFTKGLKNACRKKNHLYKESIKSKSTTDEIKYKMYKNKLTTIIRNCEKKYYDTLFENNKGNIKKTWEVINSLVRPKSKDPDEYKDLIKNGKTKKDVANEFNDFFSNVGPNLAKQIKTTHQTYETFMKQRISNTMFLKPVTEDELMNTVKSMQSKKSLDYLGVDMSLVKQIMPNIKNNFLTICNKSLEQGIFPDAMKTAKVVPIFKSGDKSRYNNYRPISLLPQFSKLLEKLFTTRLDSFLNKNDVLYQSQYGFQRNLSTSSAVMELIEEITNNIEQKKKTGGIFIDLKKAFDTVNHEILIRKAEHYGLRGKVNDWLKSYLSNRRQYVVIGEEKSRELPVTCGVPQGSVLGPKLFLLYINDITNVTNLMKFILFADDTTILCSDKNSDQLIKTINEELDRLYNWFSANKLSLNVSKTNYLLFYKDNTSNNPIKINNEIIEKASVSKFLGVYLDDQLNWKYHINHVIAKLSKTLGIMHNMRNLLNENTLRTIYCSLFLPYLNYCSEVWGNTYQTNLLRIITLQKKALRIICNVGRLDHTNNLFKRLNLLKFMDLIKYKTTIVMHQIFNKQMARNIRKFYTTHETNHASRHTNNFFKPQYRTNKKGQCLSIVGVNTWNKLDKELTKIKNLSNFKFRLKKSLINSY